MAACVAALALPWSVRGAIAAGMSETTAGPAEVIDIFRRHCARCHEAELVTSPPARGGLGNILDLEALARRDDLVRAGDPDSSRLFQLLLARHRPLDVFFGPVPGPTPEEILKVRDWLAALNGMRDGACKNVALITPDDIRADAEAWREFAAAGGPGTRFISLASLHNACRGEDQLARYRGAVEQLLGLLAEGGQRPVVETVGEASLLLAFQPADMGWKLERWDALAGLEARDEGIVEAPALAARAANVGFAGGAWDPTDAGALVDGLPPLAALRSEHTRYVSLQRAAAEMGRGSDDFARRLADRDGPLRELALRLVQSGLPRSDWERLKAGLTGRPGVAFDSPEIGPPQLDLALWTDMTRYRVGDLLTIYARPSGRCHLTILAVEADDTATVLFPNETEPNNLVEAGRKVMIPPPNAGYRLRLDTKGRKNIVAICNARAKRPEGIGHDFERQRFTMLGPWRAFLLSSAVKEAQYRQAQAELRRFRVGRLEPTEDLADEIVSGSDAETRAGLSFLVE